MENPNSTPQFSHPRKKGLSMWRPLLTVACMSAVCSGLVVFSSNRSEAQQKVGATELSPAAVAQIQALMAEKAARTPAQRKMSSQLIYASKMARGEAVANGAVRTLATDVEVKEGQTTVEIRAAVTRDILQQIKSLGGTVIRAFSFANTIEARMPMASLETLAANPAVRFIAEPSGRMLNGRPSLAERQARVRSKIQEALAKYAQNPGAITNIGSVNSQGDASHRANQARSTFNVNGSGVRIGVLSDSFNATGGAAADITRGDLPGAGNPNGFTTPVRLVGSGDLAPGQGGIDEGRAMLQIVHDLAPGAQLFYATAFNSITDFANNIRALRNAGCNIIIDDVFYFTETGLHDGQPRATDQNMAVVTQAVNDVTANGALYFSSAGNSGNLNDGTSGSWEGDYRAGALPGALAGQGSDALIFSGTTTSNGVTAGSVVSMQWSDPLGGSANDYDLFVLNSTLTTVLASATNAQTGLQDPLEIVQVPNVSGARLVVVRFSGAARFMSISANRGRFQFATAGQIRGHAGAANAFAVAATQATGAVFTSANRVETFSSDGLRRVFFAANGAAITPGNFLAATGGGLLRQKPEITAADGVSTTLPANSGLNPFFGTSAAAPHAGAIAALVRSARAGLTNAQIRTALTSTAIDIEAPGVDRDSGVGIIDAFRAVQSVR
jgi:hypothetical protein